MITNMDFNSYTYCPFQYEVDELLSILEQQTQELHNTERASGHSSTAARDTWLTHVTSKAHSEQLEDEIWTSFRRTLSDLQTCYSSGYCQKI